MRVVCLSIKIVCFKWEVWGCNIKYRGFLFFVIVGSWFRLIGYWIIGIYIYLFLWEFVRLIFFLRLKMYLVLFEIYFENVRMESVFN